MQRYAFNRREPNKWGSKEKRKKLRNLMVVYKIGQLYEIRNT
jgi:hypothetical protein